MVGVVSDGCGEWWVWSKVGVVSGGYGHSLVDGCAVGSEVGAGYAALTNGGVGVVVALMSRQSLG